MTCASTDQEGRAPNLAPTRSSEFPWPPVDAPGPPTQVARRDLTTSAGIAARVPRTAGGRHDRRGPSRHAARTHAGDERTENPGDGNYASATAHHVHREHDDN